MTVHYHGTPITPRRVLDQLAGLNFCVSYMRPDDVKTVHQIGSSVMLDNGAFSAWRSGKTVDWPGYYKWCERWLEYATTWAVIPDIIDGDEARNDQLMAEWPHGDRGAPVWHLHESLDRLAGLARWWPRICIGSSGQYSRVGSAAWHERMSEVFTTVDLTQTWVHMLRGMHLSGGIYPFASVDSTDIARNHNRPTNRNDVLEMALRWDRLQCPAQWEHP